MSNKSKTLKRLAGMGDEELLKEEGEMREAVWKLRIQRATGQTAEETGKLAEARRDLARVLTIRRQREAASGRKG